MTAHDWKDTGGRSPDGGSLDRCRLCGAESHRPPESDPGPRVLLLPNRTQGPECPDSCEETEGAQAVWLTHLE